MKMNATIKVEFEMIPDQPENAANAALERGLGELRVGIQGSGVASGVKPNSTFAEIVKKKITP
jgi:hypothetical protein